MDLLEIKTRYDVARLVDGLTRKEVSKAIADLGEEAIIERTIEALRTTARPTGSLPDSAILGWELIGERTRHHLYFVVEKGVFDARPGRPAHRPSATITLSVGDFLGVMGGTLDLVRAYLSRRVRVSGDLMFARSVEQWFGR